MTALTIPTTTGSRSAWWLSGGLAVLVAGVVGVTLGPAGPTWWRVPIALLDHLPLISLDSGVSEAQWNIVWQIRAPRVVLAALVGAMLSLAGASYQGVFRNPLVDPYLLGVAAGAGLGATLAFAVGRETTTTWAIDPVPLAAFVGGLVAVVLTYTIGTAFGRLAGNRAAAAALGLPPPPAPHTLLPIGAQHASA